MKKRFVIVFFCIVAVMAFSVIMLQHTNNNKVVSYEVPISTKTTTNPQRINKSQVDTPRINTDDTITSEKMDVADEKQTPAWLQPKNDTDTKTKKDPPTKHFAVQQQPKEKWMLKDPSKMDIDEQRVVMYDSLLEQFGDVPAVHAFMDYEYKTASSQFLSIEDDIKGMEATYTLFPTKTNQKTLNFLHWLKDKGLSIETFGNDISETDTVELRKIGINIDVTDNKDSRRVVITTK